MHTVLSSELFVDDHRRSLLAAGAASRARREARRDQSAGGPSRVTPALRTAVGWWMVHAGLRLAASQPLAAGQRPTLDPLAAGQRPALDRRPALERHPG